MKEGFVLQSWYRRKRGKEMNVSVIVVVVVVVIGTNQQASWWKQQQMLSFILLIPEGLITLVIARNGWAAALVMMLNFIKKVIYLNLTLFLTYISQEEGRRGLGLSDSKLSQLANGCLQWVSNLGPILKKKFSADIIAVFLTAKRNAKKPKIRLIFCCKMAYSLHWNK